MKRKLNKKGFTLAELLIVVAIIGVLVAISIPIFNNQLRKARMATNQANGRAAFSAAEAAYLDYVAAHGSIDANQTTTVGNKSYSTVTYSYFIEAGKGILRGYFKGGAWLVGSKPGDKFCTNTDISTWTVDTACGDGYKIGDRVAKIWTIHMNADNGSIIGYYCAYPNPSYTEDTGGWAYYQGVLKSFAEGTESKYVQK